MNPIRWLKQRLKPYAEEVNEDLGIPANALFVFALVGLFVAAAGLAHTATKRRH